MICCNKNIQSDLIIENIKNDKIDMQNFDIGTDNNIKIISPAGLDIEKVYQVQTETKTINLKFENFCQFIKDNYKIVIIVLIILLILK